MPKVTVSIEFNPGENFPFKIITKPVQKNLIENIKTQLRAAGNEIIDKDTDSIIITPNVKLHRLLGDVDPLKKDPRKDATKANLIEEKKWESALLKQKKLKERENIPPEGQSIYQALEKLFEQLKQNDLDIQLDDKFFENLDKAVDGYLTNYHYPLKELGFQEIQYEKGTPQTLITISDVVNTLRKDLIKNYLRERTVLHKFRHDSDGTSEDPFDEDYIPMPPLQCIGTISGLENLNRLLAQYNLSPDESCIAKSKYFKNVAKPKFSFHAILKEQELKKQQELASQSSSSASSVSSVSSVSTIIQETKPDIDWLNKTMKNNPDTTISDLIFHSKGVEDKATFVKFNECLGMWYYDFGRKNPTGDAGKKWEAALAELCQRLTKKLGKDTFSKIFNDSFLASPGNYKLENLLQKTTASAFAVSLFQPEEKKTDKVQEEFNKKLDEANKNPTMENVKALVDNICQSPTKEKFEKCNQCLKKVNVKKLVSENDFKKVRDDFVEAIIKFKDRDLLREAAGLDFINERRWINIGTTDARDKIEEAIKALTPSP